MPRIRRAPLFIPADDPKKIKKGLTLNADAVILELEDGVAYSQKAEARQNIVDALTTLNFGRSERLVRINAVTTELAETDIETTMIGQPDGYMVPKVDSAETLKWVSEQITAWENKHGWPEGEIKLLAIIESALGVMNLREIATADPRLEALIFGAEDLAGDMGAIRTDAGWEGFYARSAVVTAAAAFGLEAIDTPHVTIKDSTGLTTQAQRALELGYSGKLAIHPAQLEPIHHIFTPTPERIAAAKRLLQAFNNHKAQGKGVFTLDGKMVDMPMVRAAQKIIDKAQQIGFET